MKQLMLGILLLPFLTGFGSKHSSLKTSTSVQGDELILQFKIQANKGMMLTHQAPWSLSLTNFKSLKLEQKLKIEAKNFEGKHLNILELGE